MASTTQTGLAPVDQMRGLLKAKEQALKNFLGDQKNALRFMSSVMQCVQTNPQLLQCDKNSLMGAFMECAALGLYPGSGDCFVIPYANKAQFQIGYKGLKTLAYRANVKRLGMEVVYSKDVYKEERGTNPRIIHEPFLGDDRGEPIRAYAWAEISDGTTVFKSMSKAEIMKIKAMSKASKSANSPWNSNDPMLTMWQKTVFKQLAKMLPTSEALERAVHADNVSERGGYYKGEGDLVEVAFESEGDGDTFNNAIEAIKAIKSESEYKRVIASIAATSGKLNETQQKEITELCKAKQAEIKAAKKPSTKKELSAGEKVAEQMGAKINPDTGEISEEKTTAEAAEEIFNPAE